MSNLIEQYGTSWFTSKFAGSFFLHDDKPTRVLEALSDRRVLCRSVSKTADGRIDSDMIEVPADTFMTSSVFGVPELGYRHHNDGMFLTFLRRNNTSYVRGVSNRNLVSNPCSFTRMLSSRGVVHPTLSEDELNYLALKPGFVSLAEGIAQVRAGDLASFAVSPTIAVVPSPSSPSTLAILFCGKSIGNVDANGNIRISSPVANSYIEALNDQ